MRFVGAIQKFFNEVIVELKKVSWTTRQELIISAWIVVVSSLCLGVFIAGADLVLSGLISLIIK